MLHWVVARGHPCIFVGDFNVEPTKIPCLAKGISAGLWVDLEASWALAGGMQPASTCKRAWGLVVVIVAISWLVASLLLLFFLVRSSLTGGVLHILLFGPYLIAVGGLVGLFSRYSVLLYGLLLGCLLFMRAGGLSRLRFRGFGRFTMIVCSLSRHDAIQLDESLAADEVSRAWLVWSGAAETALADAYQFCGGPLPARGLVLGRGGALFWVVRLGGHKVRKARGNAADCSRCCRCVLIPRLFYGSLAGREAWVQGFHGCP